MLDHYSIGVIFDMDGVLVDSADAHYESWRRLGAKTGVVISREQFRKTFGRQNKDIIPEYFGVRSEDQIKELADEKENIYRDLIRDRPPIVPGAAKLVSSLADAGFKLAVGSSAPLENIELVLDLARIRPYFKAIVSSADVKRGKPHPDVFTISCQKLGLPPKNCVVIEDAPVGVEAAKTAGTKCIAIRMEHTAPELARADLVVERLTDISARTVEDLIVSRA